MTSIPRLRLTARRPGSWMARLGMAVTAVLAVLLTAAVVIAGFFIGLVVVGLAVLAALVFWIRGKLRGGNRRPDVGAGRKPVIIEGEYVVLSGRARERS